MLHFFLAAALSSAVHSPLFKPPAGFHELSRDPILARNIERGNGTFVAEYRRTVHEPYDNGKVLLSESVVITISTGNGFGLDPQAFAQTTLQAMQRHAKLRDVVTKPLSLCGGRVGWLLSYALPGPQGERYVELYARGGTMLYITRVSYPESTGDLGAVRALSTLCPPPPTAAAQAQSHESLPFALSAGWNRTSEIRGVFAAPFEAVGQWLRLSPHSSFIESLLLVKGPPLPDGMTAQDQSQAMVGYMQQNMPNFSLKSSRAQSYCGTDGWLTSYTEREGQNSYTFYRAFAYGSNESYFLTYTRKSGDPEDPSAMHALQSLCAPAAPSPSPAPSAEVSSPPEPASSATPRRSRR